MPLTISHPAIVLPAKYLPEKWISWTGLIVGSMTPDFEYFLRMKVESVYSHTWMGTLWFDLPLGLLLTFVYHYIVRDSLICNSPRFIKKRLTIYIDFSWWNYFKRNILVVLICLYVGIGSHLFWDGFTHPHGDFVKIIPFLRESTDMFGFRVKYYRILQNISSVVGGLIVFIAFMKIPRAQEFVKMRNPVFYWFIVIGTGIVAANIRILLGVPYTDYYTVAVSALSGWIAGTIMAPFFLEKRIVKRVVVNPDSSLRSK